MPDRERQNEEEQLHAKRRQEEARLRAEQQGEEERLRAICRGLLPPPMPEPLVKQVVRILMAKLDVQKIKGIRELTDLAREFISLRLMSPRLLFLLGMNPAPTQGGGQQGPLASAEKDASPQDSASEASAGKTKPEMPKICSSMARLLRRLEAELAKEKADLAKKKQEMPKTSSSMARWQRHLKVDLAKAGNRAGWDDSFLALGLAMCFAASAYPKPAGQMPNTLLARRVEAWLKEFVLLRRSGAACATVTRLPRGVPQSDLVSALAGEGRDPREADLRANGAALFLASCHRYELRRILQNWRTEGPLFQFYRRWCFPLPSNVAAEDLTTRRTPHWGRVKVRFQETCVGAHPDLITRAIILEQMLWNASRAFLEPTMQSVKDFWDPLATKLESGFPYYDFRSRFVWFVKQCLHFWFVRPDPAPVQIEDDGEIIDESAGGELTPEILRAVREGYRLVRSTFYARPRMTLKDIETALNKGASPDQTAEAASDRPKRRPRGKSHAEIVADAQDSGISFEVTREVETQLNKLGFSADQIDTIRASMGPRVKVPTPLTMHDMLERSQQGASPEQIVEAARAQGVSSEITDCVRVKLRSCGFSDAQLASLKPSPEAALQAPLALDDILRQSQAGVSQEQIVVAASVRGVRFEITESALSQLQARGFDDHQIDALKAALRAADNERVRNILDVLWHYRIRHRVAPDGDDEKRMVKEIAGQFAENTDTIHTYLRRLRFRLDAYRLARIERLSDQEIVDGESKKWRSVGCVESIAALARAVLPEASLLWAFGAHVFLHDWVDRHPHHSDPWTWPRFLRELWHWVDGETLERAVREGIREGSVIDDVAQRAMGKPPLSELLDDLRRCRDVAQAGLCVEEAGASRKLQSWVDEFQRIIETLAGPCRSGGCSPDLFGTWKRLVEPHWLIPVWYLTVLEKVEEKHMHVRLQAGPDSPDINKLRQEIGKVLPQAAASLSSDSSACPGTVSSSVRRMP
jgi:hypothetical protein